MEQIPLRRADNRPSFLLALSLHRPKRRISSVRQPIDVFVDLHVHDCARHATTAATSVVCGYEPSRHLDKHLSRMSGHRGADGTCASSRRRTAPCCPCILKPYTSTRSWRAATRSLRTSTCRRPPDRNSRVDRFRDRRSHDPVELVRAALHRGGLLEEISRAVLQAVRLHASSRRLVSQLRGLGAVPEFVLGGPRPRGRRGQGPPRPRPRSHARLAWLPCAL